MIKTPIISEKGAVNKTRFTCTILLALLIPSSLPSNVNAKGITAETVLKSTNTITGEKIVYPLTGEALVEVMIVTILPGEKTRLHRHGVPMIAYILEGELSVFYEGLGVKTFPQGSSFIETMDVNHFGENRALRPVRVLAVYAGARGSKTVLPAKK